MSAGTRRSKAERLRRLHQGEAVLVLPNAWDASNARVFEGCGFSAVATTSAGIAWALGYPDGERLGRDEMAEVTARVAAAVSVPVTADVEAGYGATPEAAAETARAVIGVGAVGLNLEDSVDPTPPGPAAPSGGGNGPSPLLELGAQLEKIRAVVEAGRKAGVPLVVNARTDLYWRSVGEPGRRFGEAVRRANAFLETGADCVFVPGVRDPGTIAALAREIAGPLNVLAGPGVPPVAELAGLGVKRVSVGSGPARAVMGLLGRIGRELVEEGTYSEISHNAVPYPEANALFARAPEGDERRGG
ncbi:MAG: Carboxyvinyl-carboxyphosphonate phosphorylmutase [uncultured Rubrobacteraceae bacterium]|uniref:Carboxyvinyl-carboxyphosphonate phosphorylmutase n=1 Tax=uncultured Rubrobacteraceae bacterium TaxID=349277 RepID=A0A6J4QEP3_9ACTN|nr:MAG: Carboxyvinyl-carboxyphosphonate phosphorylmutase [uncultured Rubrobacteraceae bacterium]